LLLLEQWDIEFALGDAAYDSEKVRQTAEQAEIMFISPINCCNSEEQKKVSMAEFFPFFKRGLANGYLRFFARLSMYLMS
jgi:hypothetical protein